MRTYITGSEEALRRLGLSKFATESNPLIQGAKLETDKPVKVPESPMWPPPPHATSGTALNPKVASTALLPRSQS